LLSRPANTPDAASRLWRDTWALADLPFGNGRYDYLISLGHDLWSRSRR
jgi:hypothetical protein